jgi:hypothetical protein
MTPLVVYSLSVVAEFDDIISNYTTTLAYKLNVSANIISNNETFKLIRYDKNSLNYDIIPTYGLFRSVIVNSNNEVVCFSPPKSISADLFIKKYNLVDETLVAEQFVEGTMINVFWDYKNNLWEIATRNNIGGKSSFYKTKNAKTFRDMFFEAVAYSNLDLNSLNKNLCYSFVLQHPENRIVVPFKEPQLYLISIYMIDNTEPFDIKVGIIDKSDFLTIHTNTKIKLPTIYKFNAYSELIEKYASMNTSYDTLGVVIHNNKTGERTKIRNPVYEQVKQLRGNQPKLQYQYLCLRKEGKVGDFLNFFPEHKTEFSSFRDQIHLFTNTLYLNYISCYIKKEKPLIEFSDQYRTHMFNIHKHFLNELKEQKLYVNNTVVIKYVNNLHPSLLMFCLNFQMRKRSVDFIKSNDL